MILYMRRISFSRDVRALLCIYMYIYRRVADTSAVHVADSSIRFFAYYMYIYVSVYIMHVFKRLERLFFSYFLYVYVFWNVVFFCSACTIQLLGAVKSIVGFFSQCPWKISCLRRRSTIYFADPHCLVLRINGLEVCELIVTRMDFNGVDLNTRTRHEKSYKVARTKIYIFQELACTHVLIGKAKCRCNTMLSGSQFVI